MKWLGLTWDEGPEVGGNFGPYLQTQRFDTYTEALECLKKRDAVYPCFCTKEELDAKRAAAKRAKVAILDTTAPAAILTKKKPSVALKQVSLMYGV